MIEHATNVCVGGAADGRKIRDDHGRRSSILVDTYDQGPLDFSKPMPEPDPLEAFTREIYLHSVISDGDVRVTFWRKDGMNYADAVFHLLALHGKMKKS